MGFKCGIVGLPNVGKSTLFNALTNAEIGAANYPFCTIDPNVGVVPVPDTRLKAIADIVNPSSLIPTSMEFVDIAGLVAGASKGEGLGNKFLGNIRETDAIGHVVRCFEDDDVVHVDGRIDPLGDIATIETELALADLESLDRAEQRLLKQVKANDKTAKMALETLPALRQALDEQSSVRGVAINDPVEPFFAALNLLTAKPVMYIANVDEEGLNGSENLAKVQQHAADQGAVVVPICAAIEAELAQLEPEERDEYLQELGLEEPGLHRLIRAGYELLALKTYFTAGPKEVRAWTVHRDAKAPQAAGRIHTDFERGFIRAEVIGFDDFVTLGGEAKAREAGKLRLEGKDYLVAEGDIIHFRFNV